MRTIILPVGEMNIPLGHVPHDCFEHMDHEGICIVCGYECPHDDLEDFQCLHCGKDCTEDIMSRAYDSYKDRD